MDLKIILEKHKKWLETRDSDEVSGERADLRRADLRRANLNGADLSEADLSEADLNGADLRRADLRWANLSGADLSEANLRRADLSGANLRRADLSGANLSGANLSGADLSEANLRRADLRRADLRRADLSGANLDDVRYDEYTAFFALQCPEKGAFTAYKKADGYIIELEVPADAKRSSATSRKCRCSKAVVTGITNLDGTRTGRTEAASDHDRSFVYHLGELVQVADFDEDRWNECSTGIHFFITREEAVQYGG